MLSPLMMAGLLAVAVGACTNAMDRPPGTASDDDQTLPPDDPDASPMTTPAPTDTRAKDPVSSPPGDRDAATGTDDTARTEADVGGGKGDGPAGSATAVACSASALVCDDFEDGDLAGWVKQESGGKVEVEGTHSYGGARAVRVTIPAGQRGGFITRKGAPLFPLPKKTLYGRMMVFYEDMAGGHFDTIRGGTAGGGTPWLDIGGQGKAFFLNYFNGGSDCWSVPSGRPAVPRNKWMCWEWMFDVATNHIQFWVDGKQLREVKGPGDGCVSGGNATWAAPNLGSIQLGEFNAQTNGAQTRMWLDDVALGTAERLGCPPAAATAH